MDKNIEVLQEVLDLLEEEKRKFYSLIEENDFRIEEINSYLRELSKNEEDDFKVFSPRNAENMHRKQIETDTSEMKKYEKENIEYQGKIEHLKLLISKVNIVVDNLHMKDEKIKEQTVQNKTIVEESYNKKDETGSVEDDITVTDFEIENNFENTEYTKNKNIGQEKIERNSNEKDIQNFLLEKNHVAHQILNCVSFITSDVQRAKIELTALARKIKE